MSKDFTWSTGSEIAAAVAAGETTALAVTEAALAVIAARNPTLNAFTAVTAERARAKAKAVDASPDKTKLPLAGVPFAVKNLFDIEGLATVAGSKINRAHAPAKRDAELIERMEKAGAVLVGALNMGEYAYDFTGENAHYGPSRNPHDLNRMTGGSSGGSGACVAAGMVPLSLGSDTNGSIRVPSSFCGLFGLKPTYGRLSRAGTFPFIASLDHLGPLTRSVADLALAYDCLQRRDVDDPAQAPRDIENTAGQIELGVANLRIARASGFFEDAADAAGRKAVDLVAASLGSTARADYPEPLRARAAAFLITMAEGAALHLDNVRARAADYDPDVRERLMAGALLPAAWVQKAQKFRRWHAAATSQMFQDVDILIAPSTPCQAPVLGQKMFTLAGTEVPVRANLGVFTQPFSFIGLPIVSVPVWLDGEKLPIGVQLIAAPWREDIVLRAARALEAAGVATAPIAKLGVA